MNLKEKVDEFLSFMNKKKDESFNLLYSVDHSISDLHIYENVCFVYSVAGALFGGTDMIFRVKIFREFLLSVDDGLKKLNKEHFDSFGSAILSHNEMMNKYDEIVFLPLCEWEKN